MRQLIEQQARLDARAAAELNEQRALADTIRDVPRVSLEDAALGARDIIFGQLANLIEELRAAGIIEIRRGDLFRLTLEASQQVGHERLAPRLAVLQGQWNSMRRRHAS